MERGLGFGTWLLQNGADGRVFSFRIEFCAWQQAPRGWTCTVKLMDYQEDAGEYSTFGLFSRIWERKGLGPLIKPRSIMGL